MEPNASTSRDLPTPIELLPAMGTASIGQPIFFRSLYFVGPTGGAEPGLSELTDPLDPFAAGNSAKLRPAVGVLTVHQQSWTQTGMELGNLLNSICLAPGEVTRVAVTDWKRKMEGSSAEGQTQTEEVESQTAQQRRISELQDAMVAEQQSGESRASASSVTNQAGVSGGLLWGSVSAASSSASSAALTAQFSAGRRDLALHSTNAIMQGTAEKAHAIRARQQTIVREVSEKEVETLSTRVLANYNRRHALNVLFFQILQVYKVQTQLVDWDRCLFVPMKPIAFNKADGGLASILKHGSALLGILRPLNLPGLVQRLERVLATQADDAPTLEAAKAARDTLLAQIDELRRRAHPDTPAVPAGATADAAAAYRQSTAAFAETQLHLLEAEAAKPLPAGLGLCELLDQDRLFLNQQLWLRLNPDQIYRMLQGLAVDGEPVLDRLDPHPVGVFGNYLAFRWGFAQTEAGQAARGAWAKAHLNKDDESGTYQGQEVRIGLPGLGVFSEAVLGRALAAEESSDLYARWSAEENRIPILPPGIADIKHEERAKATMDLKPSGDFASALATLRAEKITDASYIEKMLGVLGSGSTFRDMSNAAKTGELAAKLADTTAAGAISAGTLAEKGWEAFQQTFSKAFDTFIKSDAGKSAFANLSEAKAPAEPAKDKPTKDKPAAEKADAKA